MHVQFAVLLTVVAFSTGAISRGIEIAQTQGDGFTITVDCDPALEGTQQSCHLPTAGSPVEVHLVLENWSTDTVYVGTFNTRVITSQSVLSPAAGADLNTNSMPDLNDSLSGSWSCGLPSPRAAQNPNWEDRYDLEPSPSWNVFGDGTSLSRMFKRSWAVLALLA